MHPYDHARSSARLHGGAWENYNAFHSWFDATKTLQCRFTHRALRHHLEGVAEAVAIFGPVIRNCDGIDVETECLGVQHLGEDCRILPEAADWLIGFEQPDWLPMCVPQAADLARDSARRFGGDAENYRPLHDWFLATVDWTTGSDHLAFRHHAFSIFEAEARFGPAMSTTDRLSVPTRVVAERHVNSVLGRVPSAVDFLRRIKGERWMLQATSSRKLGLD